MLLLCSLGLEEASLLAASTSGRHLPREGEQGLEMGARNGVILLIYPKEIPSIHGVM